MTKTTKWITGIVAGASVVLAVVGYTNRAQISDWVWEQQKQEVPPATNIGELGLNLNAEVNRNQFTNEQTNTAPKEELVIPAEFNLAIPFTSQAPFGVWDHAHGEYCEEASLLMANRFLNGRSIDGPQDADDAMTAIADWEVDRFGYFESTTAEETATIAREYLGLQARVVKDFTWEQVKEELLQGHMVILPAAGRELGNPFYTPPGPIYHMLIVKGWTSTHIITNDPGTRRGADYVYTPDMLYNAVGDYNHNDPTNGEKVMVVVWK